jgi:8-oxo-dGTP diphosphatase
MKEENNFYNTNVGISTKAIIVNPEGKLLTIRRTETAPTNPLKWDLPGGDIDFGEDPEASVLREVMEESGLKAIDPKIFDAVGQIIPKDMNGKELFWVTLCYLIENFSGEVKLSYEHDLVQWVTPQEFLRLPTTEKLQKFVKKLLNESKK